MGVACIWVIIPALSRSVKYHLCIYLTFRYIELLQALILFTPTDHTDKINLHKFVQQLDQLNNEVKEVSDDLVSVADDVLVCL